MNHQHTTDGSKAAFGIFRRRSEVSAAKAALSANGFSRSDISVLYPSHPGAKDFPSRQKSTVRTGAMMGAAIGGLIFFLIGVAVSLRNPIISESLLGQMLFVIAGFIGGAIFGAAAGALVGIGTPQRAELRYGDYVDAGGILMSVHVDNAEQADKAQKTLEQTGAQDINLISEGQGWETVYGKIFHHA